jgi:LruC domain-containing protein
LPVPRSTVASIARRIGGGPPKAIEASQQDADLTFVISDNLLADVFGNVPPIVNARASDPPLTGPGIEVFVRFTAPVSLALSAAPFDPFIFRVTDPSHEIHLPPFCGTAAMNNALFGTGIDASNPSTPRCYVDTSGLPSALHIPAEVDYPLEGVQIHNLYPRIVSFAASGGTQDQDWYTSPVPAFAYPTRVPGAFPGSTGITGLADCHALSVGMAPATGYWIDTVDNGNDPFNAGCHLQYTDAICNNRDLNQYGDVCHQNGLDLTEWTDRMCHPAQPLDHRTAYCDFLCKTQNNPAKDGCCETVRINCGNDPMMPSARCKCVNQGARCP